MAMEVDEALALLGRFSRWHVVIYVVLSVSTTFPACWHVLAIVFLGGVPDYHCKVPPGEANTSIPMVRNDEGKQVRDKCHIFGNQTLNGVVYNNVSVPCNDGFTYITDYKNTIVMEWELVCEREYMKDMTQTFFVLGVMAGAMVFTTLSDNFGRKPVFIGVNWAMVIIGTIQVFINDYYVFTFFRFLTGALQQGIVLSGFVLCCEIFPADQRTFAGIIVQTFWAVAMMIQAGIGYAVRDWRMFQLAISLPMVVTVVGFWIYPESVPWQVANNKEKEAEEQLRKIAKFNGLKDYPAHPFTGKSALAGSPILNSMEDGDVSSKDEEKTEIENTEDKKEDNQKKKFDVKALFNCCKKKPEPKEGQKRRDNILTIFRHPKLRLYLAIMCALWFVNSLVYFGLSLSTADLAGNRYMNYFVSGLVEMIAYGQSYFVLKRFGRRIPLCIYHTIAGVGLVISIAIPAKTASGTDLTGLVICFNMIGKFGISASFGEVFLYAGELFPTNVRNTSMGVCSVAARVAGMLAPFSSLLMRKVFWLPGVIFGCLSVLVGLLALLLPETLGRPLPQNVEEMESWDSKRGRAKSFDIHANMRKRPSRNIEAEDTNV
ncbi:organic cation transporter protein-like [Lineus longissimus]|uniref:organic cation transporter protein-like n=1 Tax=Lineus longissimus TaxID=88925 RepID=UPI002B4CAE11